MTDIERFTKAVSNLEQKLAEARKRGIALATELRVAMAKVDSDPRDGGARNAQGALNKQIEATGRLCKSLERQVKEARTRVEMAQAQTDMVRMKAAAAMEAGVPQDRWYECETPDHKRVRHQARCLEAIRARLLPNYRVIGEVVGCDSNGKDGFVVSTDRAELLKFLESARA